QLVRREASRDFREAASWKDLEERLARRGLFLEARGRGLVVTDGLEVAKVSSIAREISRIKLEQRFGAMYAQTHEDPSGRPAGEPGDRGPADQPARAAGTAERAAGPGSGGERRDAGGAVEPSHGAERDGGGDRAGARADG